MQATLRRSGPPAREGGAPSPPEAERDGRRPPWRLAAAAGVVVAVAAGAALRLWSASPLWLDEALSVAISRLPLADLPDALARDGHPPLYYLLLHGWMDAFGESDLAVRSLSMVFGVAALPLAWVAGRRVAGPLAGAATLVLLATSPYAVRFASEARMYSLVVLLVVAGWLALRAALDRPTTGRLLGVAVVAALLLYTHYWSILLLAALAAVLALAAALRRHPAAGRVLLALALGGAAFLPWVPTLLEQARSTGTPWASPARPTTILVQTLVDYGGGGTLAESQLLGAGLAVLALVALVGRAAGTRRLELDLRTRPGARPELAVFAATLLVATVVGYATGSGFTGRYSSVVLVPFLLAAGLGLARLPSAGLRAGVLTVLGAMGLVLAFKAVEDDRTAAGRIAAAIAADAGPDDLVAYCPDLLGPSVSRLLPGSLDGVTYPELASPERVDWVDYTERVGGADPTRFAAEVHRRAGTGGIWLVSSSGYRVSGQACDAVAGALDGLRSPRTTVVPEGDEFEHAWLWRYP